MQWLHKRSPRLAAAGVHTTGWTGNRASRAPFNLFAELEELKKTLKRTEGVVSVLEGTALRCPRASAVTRRMTNVMCVSPQANVKSWLPKSIARVMKRPKLVS